MATTVAVPAVAYCSRCNRQIVRKHDSFTTGYGRDRDNNVVCYRCCALEDLQDMRNHGKHTLYLSLIPAEDHHTRTFTQADGTRKAARLSNWPGSLTFENVCLSCTRRGHYTPNAGYMSRYDVWFTFEGSWWHGVSYGDFTQLCHCRKTKQRSPDAARGGYSTPAILTEG